MSAFSTAEVDLVGDEGGAPALEELSAEMTKAQAEGKYTEASIGEIKMPKYASWGDYERYLAGNVARYCTYHATEK
jgi:hypothetical protein